GGAADQLRPARQDAVPAARPTVDAVRLRPLVLRRRRRARGRDPHAGPRRDDALRRSLAEGASRCPRALDRRWQASLKEHRLAGDGSCSGGDDDTLTTAPAAKPDALAGGFSGRPNIAATMDEIGTTRLEAFSDGVFAIAATLLVLEIGVHAASGAQLG